MGRKGRVRHRSGGAGSLGSGGGGRRSQRGRSAAGEPEFLRACTGASAFRRAWQVGRRRREVAARGPLRGRAGPARSKRNRPIQLSKRPFPGCILLLDRPFPGPGAPSPGLRRYVADTYEDLIREATRRPPPPAPRRRLRRPQRPHRWHAPLDIAHLISPTLPQLQDRSVRPPYHVFDMRARPRRSLRKRRILTWLRELEREGGTVEKVWAVLDEVLEAYPGPEHARIPEAFALWTVGAARRWGARKKNCRRSPLCRRRERCTR